MASAAQLVNDCLDNDATHKTPKVAQWFLMHPRSHLHCTPTSGSWLNQVERWFGKITEQRIRRGVFKSVDELITAIDDYIAAHNQNPKPFVWTARFFAVFGGMEIGQPAGRKSIAQRFIAGSGRTRGSSPGGTTGIMPSLRPGQTVGAFVPAGLSGGRLQAQR